MNHLLLSSSCLYDKTIADTYKDINYFIMLKICPKRYIHSNKEWDERLIIFRSNLVEGIHAYLACANDDWIAGKFGIYDVSDRFQNRLFHIIFTELTELSSDAKWAKTRAQEITFKVTTTISSLQEGIGVCPSCDIHDTRLQWLKFITSLIIKLLSGEPNRACIDTIAQIKCSSCNTTMLEDGIDNRYRNNKSKAEVCHKVWNHRWYVTRSAEAKPNICDDCRLRNGNWSTRLRPRP